MTTDVSPTTFRRILAGVDLKAGGRDALALARMLQHAGGGELMALYVYPYDRSIPLLGALTIEAILPEQLQSELDSELESTGTHARPMIVSHPSPSHALHAIAEREEADLIVVGSSARAGVDRVLAGDDAIGTLHGAPCAVAIASKDYATKATEPKVIGVGFNASPEAQAAVNVAAALAERLGAQLRIVAALNVDPAIGPFYYAAQWAETWTAARAETRTRVEALAATLNVPADVVVIDGNAAKALSRLSPELDLLVLGSRRFGTLARVAMGSTSTRVAKHPSCPVLVLPRETRLVESAQTSIPDAVAAS